jgi:hypothetical protein
MSAVLDGPEIKRALVGIPSAQCWQPWLPAGSYKSDGCPEQQCEWWNQGHERGSVSSARESGRGVYTSAKPVMAASDQTGSV